MNIEPTKVYLKGYRSVFREHGEIYRTKELKKFIGDNGLRCHFGVDEDIDYGDNDYPEHSGYFYQYFSKNDIIVYKPYLLFWYPAEAIYFKLAWDMSND